LNFAKNGPLKKLGGKKSKKSQRRQKISFIFFGDFLTPDFFAGTSQKMAERSKAKSAKQSFATKIEISDILTQSFVSRF